MSVLLFVFLINLRLNNNFYFILQVPYYCVLCQKYYAVQYKIHISKTNSTTYRWICFNNDIKSCTYYPTEFNQCTHKHKVYESLLCYTYVTSCTNTATAHPILYLNIILYCSHLFHRLFFSTSLSLSLSLVSSSHQSLRVYLSASIARTRPPPTITRMTNNISNNDII